MDNQDTEMHDRLSQKVEGELEMPYVLCQECVRINAMTDVEKYKVGRTRDDFANPMITIQCYRGDTASVGDNHLVQLEGVLTCTRDGHRWPITIERNIIISTGPEMPVSESKNLNNNVPKGLRQDIEEAERCYLPSCFKASVVLCRRALQLALEDLNVVPVNGRTLGPYLAGLKQTGIPDSKTSGGARYLAAGTYALAEGVKDIGDAGAHKPESIDGQTAALYIFVAVKVLNELYP